MSENWPVLHADAVAVLSSWTPPTPSQRALAASDLTSSRDVRWWPLDALPPVFDEVLELIEAGRRRLAAPGP